MATLLKKQKTASKTAQNKKVTTKAKSNTKTEKLTPYKKKVKKNIQQGYREMLLIEQGKMEAGDAWDLLKEL